MKMLKFGKKFKIKKKKVKQVLWVKPYDDTSSHSLWLDENHVQKDNNWHKVPTCTREVEV